VVKRHRVNKKRTVKVKSSMWKPGPIKNSFLLIAIIGFFTSAYLVYPRSFNFGITFMFVFALMFIAAMVSVTKRPIIEE